MAKSSRIVKLVSEEGTGDYYTTMITTKGKKAGAKFRRKNDEKKIRKQVWLKEFLK